MDVTPLVPSGRKLIQAYGQNGFRVSGEALAGSILIRPELVLGWAVAEMGQVSLETLAPILEPAGVVEILLLGCGPRIAFVPPALRQAVRAAGAVIDAMDTGAACRTYNVLMAEERRVAAALIAVD